MKNYFTWSMLLLMANSAQATIPSAPCPKGTLGYELAHVAFNTSSSNDTFILQNYFSMDNPEHFNKSDFISNNDNSMGYYDVFAPFLRNNSVPFLSSNANFKNYVLQILPKEVGGRANEANTTDKITNSKSYIPLFFDDLCQTDEGIYNLNNFYISKKLPPAENSEPSEPNAQRSSFLMKNSGDDSVNYLQVNLIPYEKSLPDIKNYKCPTVKTDGNISYSFIGPFHYQIVSYKMKSPSFVWDSTDYLTADSLSFSNLFTYRVVKDFYTCYTPTSIKTATGSTEREVDWSTIYKDASGSIIEQNNNRCTLPGTFSNKRDDKILLLDSVTYSSEDNIHLSYEDCGCEFNALEDHATTRIEDCANVQQSPALSK